MAVNYFKTRDWWLLKVQKIREVYVRPVQGLVSGEIAQELLNAAGVGSSKKVVSCAVAMRRTTATSRIDPHSVASLAAALQEAYVADLSPGMILFIPSLWAHAVWMLPSGAPQMCTRCSSRWVEQQQHQSDEQHPQTAAFDTPAASAVVDPTAAGGALSCAPATCECFPFSSSVPRTAFKRSAPVWAGTVAPAAAITDCFITSDTTSATHLKGNHAASRFIEPPPSLVSAADKPMSFEVQAKSETADVPEAVATSAAGEREASPERQQRREGTKGPDSGGAPDDVAAENNLKTLECACCVSVNVFFIDRHPKYLAAGYVPTTDLFPFKDIYGNGDLVPYTKAVEALRTVVLPQLKSMPGELPAFYMRKMATELLALAEEIQPAAGASYGAGLNSTGIPAQATPETQLANGCNGA